MTPIAHSMVGLGGWLAGSRQACAGEMAAFVLAANLPDADFLLRLIPAVHRAMPHQYATHNLLFALLSSLVFFKLVRGIRARSALVAVALSHPVLDLLVSDRVQPIGFPILWPFSRLLFHVGGFPSLQRGDWAALVSWENLGVVLLEVLVFALPLGLLAGKKAWRLANEPDFWRWT